jgi:hypothetical protein
MPTRPDDLTDVRDVLHSTAKDGEVRVNFGDAASGEGERGDVQVWGVDGYHARPNDPDGDGACQAFYIVDGQQQRVIATRDNRNAKAAGEMDPGDRLISTKGAPRVVVKQKRQRVMLYTEAKDTPPVGGKSIALDLDGEGNLLQLRFGGCLLIADGTKWTIVAAGAATNSSIVLDASGVVITGGVINLDGGNVTVGMTAGVRPGLPGVDTALYGATGTTAVPSTSVFIAK